MVYDYPKANWEGLCNHLLDSEDLDLCLELDDVEEIWAVFKLTVSEAMSLYIPKVRIKKSELPHWFNVNLRHQHKCLKSQTFGANLYLVQLAAGIHYQ